MRISEVRTMELICLSKLGGSPRLMYGANLPPNRLEIVVILLFSIKAERNIIINNNEELNY